MNKQLTFIFAAILVLAILGASYAALVSAESGSGKYGDDIGDEDKSLGSYEACVKAGGDIQETAPPRCVYKGEVYIQGKDSVKDVTPISKFTRYVYGSGEILQISLDKYKAHCESVGGKFNTCGSLCAEGEVCAKVCAYTCEGVLKNSWDDDRGKYEVKMREESGKYEIQYKEKNDGDETEYKLKYGDGKEYEFESEYSIKGISEDKLKIKLKNGEDKDLDILPEGAVKKLFGDDSANKSVRLKEKTYNNLPRVVYNIEGEHEGKFLGIFKIKARYDGAVDAATGDVLDWNGPWWAFLITGEPSKPTVKEVGDETEVTDYDSCVKVTGISTDGIPSECIYDGEVYVQKLGDEVSDYETCVAAGNLIQETAPPRCMDKNGNTYVQGQDSKKGTVIISKKTISDFNSCLNAGYPVMESYPRQCRDSDGDIFVEIVKVESDGDSVTDDYTSCKAAGYPVTIRENYPSYCKNSDGKVYLERKKISLGDASYNTKNGNVAVTGEFVIPSEIESGGIYLVGTLYGVQSNLADAAGKSINKILLKTSHKKGEQTKVDFEFYDDGLGINPGWAYWISIEGFFSDYLDYNTGVPRLFGYCSNNPDKICNVLTNGAPSDIVITGKMI